MGASQSLTPVIFALIGNLTISILKFIVSFVTGSSAMLAEAIHSVADCTNQIFLLIGFKRSQKPADENHPFGYGKEEYFWGMLVAILLFFVGASFSIYEGTHKLFHPEELKSAYWAIIVLSASILIEAKTFHVALSHFRKKNKSSTIYKGLIATSDTSLFVILLEDFAAIVGLLIALISTLLSIYVSPVFDGIGSICVGILLATISLFLSNEIRKLIIGESLPRDARHEIKKIVSSNSVIVHVNHIKTMLVGREKFILLISIDVNDETSGYDIEDQIEQIKLDIKSKFSNAEYIYIDVRDAERNQKI